MRQPTLSVSGSEKFPSCYPQPEGAGGRHIGIERRLRIHFLQHWFNRSDQAIAVALCDSRGLRQFAGTGLCWELVPDETTVCKFRH